MFDCCTSVRIYIHDGFIRNCAVCSPPICSCNGRSIVNSNVQNLKRCFETITSENFDEAYISNILVSAKQHYLANIFAASIGVAFSSVCFVCGLQRFKTGSRNFNHLSSILFNAFHKHSTLRAHHFSSSFLKTIELSEGLNLGKRRLMDMANEQTSCAERRSENDVEPSRPTDHSKTLKDFGYHFDGDGIMKDEAGNGFIFVDQKSYEAIGEAVTEEIYSILGRPPYNLCRTYFGAASERKEQSFIYHSKDFDEQKYLVVLIHGKGVVRAGQWARRLIINESLDRGSQLPYLRECAKRGWGVLVMNTNHNTFVDAQGHRKPFMGSGSAVEHGITVWKEFVTPSKAVRIAVVAHSAGGMVISKIMEEPSCWPRGDEEKARVGCICLTDSFFDAPSLGRMCEGTRPRVRHWVAYPSHQIGAPLPSSDYVERVTAGTNVHEETSPVAVDDIFKFIETTFRSYREKE